MAQKECNGCGEHNKVVDIPYIVHESAMARMERQLKRLWITILVLIVLLVGTNGIWIWRESQFEDVVTTTTTTIEAEQDGAGVNIVGAGDVDYGAESENN